MLQGQKKKKNIKKKEEIKFFIILSLWLHENVQLWFKI